MKEQVSVVHLHGIHPYPAQHLVTVRSPFLNVNRTREKHAALGLDAKPNLGILHMEQLPCFPAPTM
jgi:hypothetical protein